MNGSVTGATITYYSLNAEHNNMLMIMTKQCLRHWCNNSLLFNWVWKVFWKLSIDTNTTTVKQKLATQTNRIITFKKMRNINQTNKSNLYM